MPKDHSDHLFLLIKSLSKSEKRYFKLKNGGGDQEDHKYLLLFDAIAKSEEFDEKKLIKNNSWIIPSQFSNLKAHLYKKLLQSLKEYSSTTNDDIAIREQIDHIQLLYDRSLYHQSMMLVQKVKRSIRKSDNLELQLEVLKWEKNLLPYSLGKNSVNRFRQIIEETNRVNEHISRINLLMNISVELNTIYLKHGYMRSKEDYDEVNEIFAHRLPKWVESSLSLREKLLWYEIHQGYYSFIQDFDPMYDYSRKWVELFENTPNSSYYFEMYIRGLNQLLNAQARLLKYDEFSATHRLLRSLAGHRMIKMNENLQIRLFKYNYAHQFNEYFLNGDFAKGVALFRRISHQMDQYISLLDVHSQLIMFYKIACLFFGNGDYSDALVWLNRIINYEDQNIREDIHSFTRILNLITHYELGNRDVIEYYLRSTYRFLHKKEDFHQFQFYILDFIKNLSRDITESELIIRFKKLRDNLLPLTTSKYEKRAFVYFDIIAWLESKIHKKTVEYVIKERAKEPVLV
ncbi:MAG: hypothetical protein ACFHWX_22800 [Bacteroidota bacterium]